MNTKSGIEKWRELDGDNTLALDWDLNEDSRVWEIGGFEGRWAQQIWDKFHCHITIFEPQMWAVEKMRKRFAGISKIDIRPYGLSTAEKTGFLSVGGFGTDGAGHYSTKDPMWAMSCVDYTYELESFYGNINLMLMNIEGMEYELLPHMAESLYITRFDSFWCQFHPGLVGIGEDDVDYRAIDVFLDLDKTHEVLWDCYPTAVAWKRK